MDKIASGALLGQPGQPAAAKGDHGQDRRLRDFQG